MAVPKGPHTDWPWPFSLIPREWTAFESTVPPVKLFGTESPEDHLDIPEPGKWVVAGAGQIKIPIYFALTAKSGWHFRIGLLRYDYVDQYYQIGTFTIKKLDLR